MVERENRLQKLFSDLQACATEVHEHKKIYKEKDEQINFREGKKGCRREELKRDKGGTKQIGEDDSPQS